MPIDFDSALGILPQALKLRAQRTETLARNLANDDTPGFKARDFDFRAAMSQARSGEVTLKTTHAGHIETGTTPGGAPELLYRVPNQPSPDGNTVDTQLEQAAFSKNAVQYQATLTFLSNKFKGLQNAIKAGSQ